MTREELQTKTKSELYAIAKREGVEGYEMMNKNVLISMLLAGEEEVPEQKKQHSIDEPSSSQSNVASSHARQRTTRESKGVVVQYHGAFRGSITKFGKTWKGLMRSTVAPEEADVLVNTFPGCFTVIK